MVPPAILKTKFLVPRLGHEQIPRPHLVSWLERNVFHRLILISAPPGYGKTTLLSEYIASRSQSSGWYQLDSADSDPAIFLAYLIECLRKAEIGGDRLGETTLALLQSQATPIHALTVLINELTDELDRDWLLVLEDYHHIASPIVHSLVDYLIENGMPNLHLVISTRSDPPLNLARLRARGQLAELRAAELRFSEQEIVQWIARLGSIMDADQVHAIWRKTEGWAAGLQLAFSSIAGRDSTIVSQLIDTLSGSNRFIFDYLAGEIFRLQIDDIQSFLLDTAVLGQMNASVCNALRGSSDAQLWLERLERQNLFLSSLDDKREWYRYHVLFREFLLAKIHSDQPELAAELEHKAGEYYLAHGESEVAFTHFIQGGNLEYSIRALSTFAEEYIELGRVEVLLRYFRQLPAALLNKNPHLLLRRGDVHWRLGQVGEAVSSYEDARARFAIAGDQVGMASALTSLAEVARSQGVYRSAQALAAEAVARLSIENQSLDHAASAMALMALAKCEGFLVGTDRGRELAEQSVEQARKAGDQLSRRSRAALLRSLGLICWWHGDPHATLRYCQEASRLIPEERSPIAAEIYITMATPYLYWRDLDQALSCAERGLDIVQYLQLGELLPIAYATLGNVLTRRGEFIRAETCLRQAMDLARGLGVESYGQIMAAGFLALNLSIQGRLDEARQIAEAAIWLESSSETYEMCVCRSVLADIELDSGNLEKAEHLYEIVLDIDRRRQYRIPLALVLLGLAYIYLVTGRRQKALEFGKESLHLIESSSTYQLYLDQGRRAKIVAEVLAQSGEFSPFLTRVQAELSSPEADAAHSAQVSSWISVHCLGNFRVLAGDQEISPERWVSTRARDLLAYFVTFRQESVPIERVINALWPEKESGSKTAFHTALYRMRQALQPTGQNARFILVEAGECRLDTARFSVDIDEFNTLISRARHSPEDEAILNYQRAVRLYQGEYLNNLYYDWLMPERQHLQGAFFHALNNLANLLAARGDYEQALDLTQRILQCDPLQEEIHCNAMRFMAAQGDRSGMVRQYQLLQQTLRDELGIEPMPATRRFYEDLFNELSK